MKMRSGLIHVVCALGLLLGAGTQTVEANEGFDDGSGATACATCHSDLTISGAAHTPHAALANSDCGTCHADGRQNNPPLSACVQCHGRVEDAGSDTVSAGLGRGLRLHHVTAGVATCDSCHGDADPTDTTLPPAVGENVQPSFYSSMANAAGLDSCDGSEEAFSPGTMSLDNDGDGQTDTADADCTPNLPPTADTGGTYNGSVGTPVSFDGSGSSDPDGTIVAWDWDFGDGNTGTGPTPTHTYAAADTYTVTLTVTDDDSESDSATTTATIMAEPLPPIADANGPYSGVVGSPVSFDGSGSSDPDGTIAAYDWDFGDGGTGSGVAPMHTYSADGMFTVTLTVTDDSGLAASDSTTATINPAGGNVPPVANANGPYTGTEGVDIQFSSSGSMDTDGTLVAYSWDFGDGATSTAENPMHAYVAAGTYTVTLTVTDDMGDTGSDSTSATIEAPVANMPPTADANGPYSGFVGEAIMFDGTGSSDPDGSIVSYDWDYGDGATAADAGPTPSHVYMAAGDYTVSLVVTDDMGETGNATASVSVQEPIPVNEGEAQYNSYCASCHGDPWAGPAVDPGLVGVRRVTGARACVIEGSIFGTYVFPNGAPGMEFLQNLVADGTVDIEKIAEYLNSQPVTGEQYYVTACAGCHGNDGRGGRTGEDVLGEDAEDTYEAIHDEPTMRYLACLPISDIEAIGMFLEGRDGHDDDSDSDDWDDDYDGDGRKDDEDEDDDNDGVSDDDERKHGTDPKDKDSDDDGLDDGDELDRGTDPNDRDTDDDGYSDGQEVTVMGTNPLVANAPSDEPKSTGSGAPSLPLLLLLATAGWLRLRKIRA